MQRRVPALAGALALGLALTGCTAPAERTTPSTASASVAPSSVPPSSPMPSSAAPSATSSIAASPGASVSASAPEQGYLGFVSQFSPTLAATPQSTLLTLGRQVCSGLATGRDVGQVSAGLGSSTLAPDLEASDAAVIIGAAIAQLCPQYRSALED